MSVSATLAIALIAVGLQTPSVAYASATQSLSRAILVASQTTTFPWKGDDPSCEVRLPISGRARYGKFTTCPPKRVLVLGDSVALTMGIEMALGQVDFGAIVDDAGINGCGFVTGYDMKFMGSFNPTRHLCDIDATVWESDIRTFRPLAIVVEMGWWDSFPHMIDGHVSSLGQPKYDALVKQQIVGLVHSIRTVSTASIYFLSVPWMQTTGDPLPASAASHNKINSLIRAAAASTKTHFVDISPYITPAGYFQADVDGGICRASDGVHLYYGPGSFIYVHTACGKALQRGVLSKIRLDLVGK